MRTDPDSSERLSAEEIAELRRLARSRPRSGRESVAKLGALRVLERVEREEARRRRLESEHSYPWESCAEGVDPLGMFQLYAWSETERILFGSLSGPAGRPPDEEDRIAAVVEALEASPDPPAAYRRWVLEALEHP